MEKQVVPCLHCVLAQMVENFSEEHGIDDSTPLFAALADVVGDLLANSEEMFARHEDIMEVFTERVIERARRFIEDDRNSSRH